MDDLSTSQLLSRLAKEFERYSEMAKSLETSLWSAGAAPGSDLQGFDLLIQSLDEVARLTGLLGRIASEETLAGSADIIMDTCLEDIRNHLSKRGHGDDFRGNSIEMF